MVRPYVVNSNALTKQDNPFQQISNLSPTELTSKGQQEFDAMVEVLRANGVNVIVDSSMNDSASPDAHFPNNWISFHQNGKIAVYPMYAENRRMERRDEVLETIEQNNFKIESGVDYTIAEEEGVFLEGTGSMVLDRKNRKAYAVLSERTDEELFIEFCEDFEFLPIPFNASSFVNGKRIPIYHTNVMMSIGERFAVVCLESIKTKKEKQLILNHLKESGLEIIAISAEQMHNFAGNVLEVMGADNQQLLVMSETAKNSFREDQLAILKKYASIVSVSIPTIELCGGGSARCMMAEVFLPYNEKISK
jgi:hypothetical protein